MDMAEDCLRHANDLSGLLLLYSSLGDSEEISKLALLAKDLGKNNVAFLCLFMLGKVEECLQLLIERLVIKKADFLFHILPLLGKIISTVISWQQSHTRSCYNGKILSS